ncbi:hypothetical protein [Rhizobacter sp. P5_C2]
MHSDLNAILGEQQAVLSLLSSRLLDESGQVNRQSFDSFARALFAHLSVLSSVVLPAMTDAGMQSQLSAPSEVASASLAHAVVLSQSNTLDMPNVATLSATATGLIAIERALIPLSMLALPVARQHELAALADEVFAKTIGPSDGDSAASRDAAEPTPL